MAHRLSHWAHMLAIIAVQIFAAGCNLPSPPTSLTRTSLGTKGVAVISATAAPADGGDRSFELIYRVDDSTMFAGLHTSPTPGAPFSKGDFDGRPEGQVYTLLLEPGQHRITSVGKTSTTSMSLNKAFSVRAGKITYVGNIHAVVRSVPGGYSLQIQTGDMRSRDLPVFFKQYPNVKPGDVDTDIMR